MTAGHWPIVLPGRLEGGKVRLNAKRLAELLKGRKDCDLEFIIERKHATRSLAQNAYYHGVVLRLISEHTGHTSDELHEFFKLKFNAKPMTFVNEHGEIVDEERIGLTTTKLNKITFGEFVEKVRQFAAEELHLNIPDPDPNWREHRREVA